MAECLFCKIANKEIASEIVKEGDRTVAFRDIDPAARTHVLVIPRDHIASAAELGPAQRGVVAEIFELLASVATDEGLERGWRVVTNVGQDAGQSVHHLHFHLVGGHPMNWPPG